MDLKEGNPMKTERLLTIIMILLEQKQISASRLAEMLEVSVRTIYRDIDSLAQSGIPVTTQTGSKGGISIMENYKIDKRFFTNSDITSLLIALESLANNISPINLQHTFEKIKTLIPEHVSEEIEFKANQIAVDLTPWTSNRKTQPVLENIKQGMDQNKLFSFNYEDNKGQKTKRIVEPYRLVLKEISWYLQAYCQSKQDFRTFKLSRIDQAQLLSQTFEPRAFNTKPLGGEPWTKKELITIQLKIHRTLKDQLIDKFGNITVLCQEDEQYLTVELRFMADDYGYNFLLGLGERCECLAPEYVRIELKKRIRKLLSLYD